MNTIYLVTSGEYSDYSIDGVFSTKNKAERYIKTAQASRLYHDDYRIEKWVLDRALREKSYKEWHCSIMLETGEMSDVKFNEEFGIPASSTSYTDIRAFSYSCKSKSHCLKLAVEARQKWMRAQALLKRKEATS